MEHWRHGRVCRNEKIRGLLRESKKAGKLVEAYRRTASGNTRRTASGNTFANHQSEHVRTSRNWGNYWASIDVGLLEVMIIRAFLGNQGMRTSTSKPDLTGRRTQKR